MAQFTIYSSTDASAPVLTGQVGSLVALLDACLVNGYGAKTAAGWTKPYTGTNKAAFRLGAGTQSYLRVQDDGPGVGAAEQARMTGYTTMSDVDTGVNPFPTAAQGPGGTLAAVICQKSLTADATARAWYVLADSRTMYLLVSYNAGVYVSFTFGDFYTVGASDTSNAYIVGRVVETGSGTDAQERLDVFSAIATAVTGSFISKTVANTGASVLMSRHGDSANSATLTVGIQQYPNGADGGLYLSQVHVVESALSNYRGRMRGFWHYCHPQTNIQTLDVFQGTGDMAGKAFLAFRTGNLGVFIFETSDTLETN